MIKQILHTLSPLNSLNSLSSLISLLPLTPLTTLFVRLTYGTNQRLSRTESGKPTQRSESRRQTCLHYAEPQGRRRMSRGFRGWVTHDSICDKHIELNLPRIASRSILGFGRWRFGRVCKLPLLSPAAPVLCFTEQLSSLVSNGIAIFRRK